MLHLHAGRPPDARALADLSVHSHQFRRRWEQHNVRIQSSGSKSSTTPSPATSPWTSNP